MTDKELIARLRQYDGWVTLEAHTHLTAADRIEALTKERDALTPWAKLGVSVMENWPDYGDIDGWELQDMAVKAGVLTEVEGGFDPEVHDDTQGVFPEPGDQWFIIRSTPATLAEIKGESHD